MDKNKVYFSQFATMYMCVHVVVIFRVETRFYSMVVFFSVKKINFIRLTFIKSGWDRFWCRPLKC